MAIISLHDDIASDDIGNSDDSESAFSGCGLTSLTIADSVTNIGWFAFGGNEFTEVNFGKTGQLSCIGAYSFSSCNLLTSIAIPDGVNTIEFEAFAYCENLETITIPDSVTSVNSSAFIGCKKLTSISFNGTTVQWKNALISSGPDTIECTIYCKDGTIAKDGSVTYYAK